MNGGTRTMRSKLEPMKKVAKTIRKHHESADMAGLEEFRLVPQLPTLASTDQYSSQSPHFVQLANCWVEGDGLPQHCCRRCEPTMKFHAMCLARFRPDPTTVDHLLIQLLPLADSHQYDTGSTASTVRVVIFVSQDFETSPPTGNSTGNELRRVARWFKGRLVRRHSPRVEVLGSRPCNSRV